MIELASDGSKRRGSETELQRHLSDEKGDPSGFHQCMCMHIIISRERAGFPRQL